MREPAVAGQFYPSSKRRLKKDIEKAFEHELGPGKIPRAETGGRRKVLGAVFPHAGYTFSGPIAAHSMNAFVNSGLPDVFVIIGPNHTGRGRGLAMSTEDFRTPLGVVPYDDEVGQIFEDNDIPVDDAAHRFEHSLEVQLPFIQYFEREDISIVPVNMRIQNLTNSEKVGNAIQQAFDEYSGRLGIIASSDLTHCGMNYGIGIPPGMSAGEYAEREDKKAIERILDLDAEGLIDTVEMEGISMCGYGPVAAMIMGLSERVRDARLLKYSTSYDIMPSASAVGYASIVLER